MKHDKCQDLTHKFNAIFPGGHSNFRVPFEATQNRIFITKAEGSHLWDADGNEYIDYMCAMGPNILGHRHPDYIQTLKEYLDEMSFAVGSGILFTPADIELGEKIIKHIPCAEKIKFCLSGTEAVQMAIRLARAYTERPYFIRFESHYHGWLDNVLGGVINPNSDEKPFGVDNPDLDLVTYTQGRNPRALEESFVLPWNDVERLEEVLDKYGEEVAIIHFEGIVCNHFGMMPKPGFIEKIRELCTKYGIVMSMDEVITGFRLGLGGAQGYLGVTPDIATFGKAMAGGVPFSAVVGKAEILNQLQDGTVLGPGTFNGNPFAVKAALTTLSILEKDNGACYDEMWRVQKGLMDGLSDLAQKYDIPVLIHGLTGVFHTLFGITKDAIYTDADLEDFDLNLLYSFWPKMHEEGIIVMAGGRWYMTMSHTDEDVDRTLEAADKTMAQM
jgi:glutamate-1-semialdehyde 2,1-aminomutase